MASGSNGDIESAVAAFAGEGPFDLWDGESGMNNTTVRIMAGGKPYILRIYNTHGDLDKACFEHAVLRKLAQWKPPLQFKVPEPVPSVTGETVVRLQQSGKLAALFVYIEGRRPELSDPMEAEAFGAATGELMGAMAGIGEVWEGGMEPRYPPYYELGSAHHRCSLEEVARLCAEPPEEFRGMEERENLRFLSGEIGRIREELAGLSRLPHQLIHGDLNATNALAHPDGSMAALLDFEFATVDLRAMEPAVCLWGLVPAAQSLVREGDEERVWESLRAFWRGFRRYVQLGPEEIAVLPVLMELRSLDVFLHFLGRFLDGVDAPDVLSGQIPDTASRMKWVSANRERLAALLGDGY